MTEVLIIDDDSFDTKLLIDQLKCNIFTVITNGEDAINFINESKRIPDLIILDLNLPRVWGDEVLTQIRSKPAFDKTPVIVFTTSQSYAEKDSCMKLGATEFITKPFSLDALRQIIKQIEKQLAITIPAPTR